MIEISNQRRVAAALLRNCIGIPALLLLLALSARAQGSGETTTPPSLTPGLPAGSYALSGFDTVNLFNGNLNFHLPLLKVGGRGGAQHPVVLKIEERWRVVGHTPCSPCGTIYYPTYNWWTGYTPGYGPGVLEARTATWGVQSTPFGDAPYSALLRITFTTSDGTEYEMRDVPTNGAPEPVTTGQFGQAVYFQRGSVFTTADGTSATFVSCAPDGTLIPLADDTYSDPDHPYPSGVLLLRDGTRYRIDGGLVQWTQDRNGNRINFFYEGHDTFGNPDGRVTRIVDSLNRQITIEYDYPDVSPYGMCDRIHFQGFNNAARIIRISKNNLRFVFRPGSGYQRRHLAYLFPDLSGSDSTPFDPTVISAVWLPDGRSYNFYYNEYGELARLLLPTGGAIEYDWDAGMLNGQVGGGLGGGAIYRRIVERRAYPGGATGVNYESRITYSRPENQTTGTNAGYVDVNQYGTGSTALTASRHYFNGSVFYNPNAGYDGQDYFPFSTGKEYKTEALDPNTLAALQRVEHTFFNQAPAWWNPPYWCTTCIPPSNNPVITDTFTTWVQESLVARQSYQYDAFSNKTQINEFDYGSGQAPAQPVRRTEIDYVSTGESNEIDYTGSNISSNMNSLPYLRSLPKEQRVYSVSSNGTATLAAKTHFYYDQTALTDRPNITGWQTPVTAARGNLTSTSRWRDTPAPAGWITTTQTYDIAGHVIQATDPLNNTSQIDFASSSNTYAFPTTLKTPAPDPTGQRGSSAMLQTIVDHDFSSGSVKSITDPNGQSTTASYDDVLDRLTGVTRPTGGGQTTYSYGDVVGSLFVRTQTTQDATQTLEGYQYFDGLGRTTISSQSEASGSISAETQYDALGRVYQVSNPYRSSDTKRWTVTQYDALSRVQTVTKPGGAVTMNAYTGNSVTITDPASKSRKTVSDALGRVTSVIEDPGTSPHLNYQTSYTYDALDDLRKVIQGGQTRYFGYDSLKRLIRVKNPEQDINSSLPPFTDPVTSNTQWSAAFTYDPNSNLATKTDPRGITCTYAYDAINRVLTRTYSGESTPTRPVDYKYDGVGTSAQFALGRLTAVNTSGSFLSSYTYDNFDRLGRVLHSTQTTEGNVYGMSYGYDLAGNLISETYPSGRVVLTALDVAGRLSDVSSGTVHYASSFSYAAHGGVTDVKLGNSLWEHTVFEPNRLQPTEIDLGTSQGSVNKLKLNYDYGSLTTNNGNVMGQTITVPSGPTLIQSYSYDGVNRLKSAQENSGSSWIQTYLYNDQFGNRRIDAGNTIPSSLVGPNPQISASTNRITSTGYSYDFAGNLKTDATGHTYDYDAENMQVKYDTAVAQYSYDGEGRRVKSVTNSGALTTVFVYDAMGKLLAEYANSNPAGGGTSYLTADALGSPRIITVTDQSVKARHDYLPFGEELQPGIGGRTAGQGYVADNVRQKFTQKERDSESGLDYFLARYYSSAQGRFTSVDPENAGADPGDAQSWNGYAYARNNPLIYVDPTGLAYDFVIDGKKYRVNDATEFEKYGYKVIGGNDDGSVLTIQGANGNQYSAQFVDVPVNNPFQVYDRSGMTPLAREFLVGMDRRAAASLKLIDIAADITLTPISIISGTALFRGGIMTLELAGATGQAIRTVGQGLKNIRPIGSGRLATYLRGNTELAGGDQAARQLFQQLTGKAPAGAFDRVVQGGKEIVYRATSTSGPSKVEIVDHAQKFLEKISFK